MKKIKNFLGKINYILDRKEKMKLVLLLLGILATTIIELIGVVAIMPFVNVVMDPSVIERTAYLKWLYDILNIQNISVFIAILGVILILVYLLKNLTLILLYYAQYAFTFNTQKKLSSRMLRCYMYQPYTFHLKNNSADLMRNIESDVTMMFQGIISMLGLIAEVCVCVILGAYLLIQDKTIAIGMMTALGLFFLMFAKPFKNYLVRIGEEDRLYRAGITKWLHQSLGGIKETKILGREEYFCEQFDKNYCDWSERQKKYRLLQVAPRPVMEAVCITTLLGVIIVKLLNGTNSAYFISTVSVFAVAAMRLLPSINRITSNYGMVMFNMPAFDAVYHDLKEIEKMNTVNYNMIGYRHGGLPFKKNIEVRNVTYSYNGSEDNVLENINLSILKNQAVAFVGPSGAGKTTLADIILGILTPQEGQVLVDGKDIAMFQTDWIGDLGYIPQNIYLMDDTIRNNVLFGQKCNNEAQLWHAVEEAQLKEFVLSLEKGMDTVIGENGICLSGGQRQRIGIARALYTNPSVLVLDEATSALDNDTEAAVMEAINHLAGNMTLIIIAHRLSTTEKCDVIFEVKDKKVTRVRGLQSGVDGRGETK